MAYVSSLSYILTAMLTTLPYYSFKSYFSNIKLNLIIIYGRAVCFTTFLKEGNNRYAYQ